MRNKPDFSKEKLRLKLPVPFKYQGPKDKEVRIVTDVEITKMAAPEIARIKGSLSSVREEKTSYATAMKEIIENSVSAYYDINGEEVLSATLSVLNQLLPLNSADKVWRFATLLTRGTSLMTTAYKCPVTGASNLFDLDPEEDVPEDIESDRSFMEDYTEFYEEKVIKDAALFDGFTATLKKLIALDFIDEEGEVVSTFEMSKMLVGWTSMKSYMKNVKDGKRSKNAETWIVFDNIKTINDFTEEETARILKHNGHDRVMRIDSSDWRNLLRKMDEYGVKNGGHSYQCLHCEDTHEDIFDMTNFFDFLKS